MAGRRTGERNLFAVFLPQVDFEAPDPDLAAGANDDAIGLIVDDGSPAGRHPDGWRTPSPRVTVDGQWERHLDRGDV